MNRPQFSSWTLLAAEGVARGDIPATKARRQKLKKGTESNVGKVNVNLPLRLSGKVVEAAVEMGETEHQFVVSAVEARLGAVG